MKGTSFVTYILVSASALAVMLMLTLIIQRYYSQYNQSFKQAAARDISSYVESEIISIYSQFYNSDIDPGNQSVTLFLKNLDLPQRISGERYYIESVTNTGLWNYLSYNISTPYESSSNKIVLRFASGEEYTYDIVNINISIQGIASYDDPVIKYVRYRIGGNMFDSIILGSNEIFFDIEKIQ